MTRITFTQFESLFLQPRLFVDVRAPIEFQTGSIPGSINLPLLNDEERHQVGLTYKEQGQQAAVTLGHQLVCNEIKETRIKNWEAALKGQPDSIIYCFRGGMRSQITQKWLAERQTERPIVAGGYKALRNFFLQTIENKIGELNFEVVSGLTGSGKTAYLKASDRPILDLEDLAAHRGSAFGALDRPQPVQADFENRLAVELLKLAQPKQTILVEREARLIGKCVLPAKLYQKILESPQITVETPFEQRVENILKDYVIEAKNKDLMFEKFERSVNAISRKLGSQRAQEILVDLKFANQEFKEKQSLESNRIWIAKLLNWYYDPMYQHALAGRSSVPRNTTG